jgi:cytochrome b561
MGLNTLIFHVLSALKHHTYSEDDVEEGGIKIKKKI